LGLLLIVPLGGEAGVWDTYKHSTTSEGSGTKVLLLVGCPSHWFTSAGVVFALPACLPTSAH